MCGKIFGYQFSSLNAFAGVNRSFRSSIGSYYVDGISLTHGRPRKHIWTFVGSIQEVGNTPINYCPCTNINQASLASIPPAFVGNDYDYFCDTGSEGQIEAIFYGDDPMWDGAGCGPLNTCCRFNNPPWFYKELPDPTTDDLEMRVCTDQGRVNEDIALANIDIIICAIVGYSYYFYDTNKTLIGN